SPHHLSRRHPQRHINNHTPTQQTLTKTNRQNTLDPLKKTATVDQTTAMIDHSDDGRRLEPAESRLEDFPSERVEIARDGHEHRGAARREEGREEHLIAGDELALASTLPEARRDPQEQRAEDGGVVVPPCSGVDETVAPVEDVEPADEGELRDELVEGARVRAPAHELRLESVEERVLRVTQHHLDLL